MNHAAPGHILSAYPKPIGVALAMRVSDDDTVPGETSPGHPDENLPSGAGRFDEHKVTML